ncbi:hypothetical protein KP509_1Z031100 [Ceratopteris richardii]|nr:hypothetical protein KP509_1Z031100 [Ceratopteris richardii]
MKLCTKLAVAVVLIALITNARCQAADVMEEGDTLREGQALVQDPYSFIMQSDCNLVLYKYGNQPLWASGTDGRGTGCVFTLQYDGNAVVYTGARNDVYSANTYGRNDGSHFIIMQRDGNVVMYNSHGNAIWATGTYGRAFSQLKPLDASALQRLRHANESAGARASQP